MSAQPENPTNGNTAREAESPFDDVQHNSERDYESDSDSDLDSAHSEKKDKSKRPPDNNFSQQRLKAVNPVFTAKTVIPILLGLGIFLVPLGAAMWLASHRIEDMTIEYTQCQYEAPTSHWEAVPEKYLSYNLKDDAELTNVVWRMENATSHNGEITDAGVCHIQVGVPHRIKGPLYFFYRLKKFHQNHRRYVQSFSEEQLNGDAASLSTIKDTVGLNCEPLSTDDDGKRIYPCGLIANSMFNDTFSPTLRGVNGSSDYVMTNEGIAWASNSNRFKKTKYDYRDIVPPPNWAKKFPNGYNSTNVPDISQWEEFQNWMFTSAFPDFHKLALRNDNDALEEGTYEIEIGLNFPVVEYHGQKYVFLSQRSPLGGKNVFLGFSWIASGAVCLALGLILLIVNMIFPRRAGDVNLLSWKREAYAKDSQ